MSELLQEILDEFACSELNFINDSIYVWHFYNEERYHSFLNGRKCWAGQGIFNSDEEALFFNQLKDNILIVIKENGVEKTRYKYITIFKGTMEYKEKNSNNKKLYRKLTFKLRKELYSKKINFMDTNKTSIDFNSIQEVKDYLRTKYGSYKLIDWGVFVE